MQQRDDKAEPSEDEPKAPLKKPYQFLHIFVLREYLRTQLEVTVSGFNWDLERAIDDFVFLCFFVGNDFLPHLPTLDIRENAILRLVELYRRLLPNNGYLTHNGVVHFEKVSVLLAELGLVRECDKEAKRADNSDDDSCSSQMEDRILRDRLDRDRQRKEREKRQREAQRERQQLQKMARQSPQNPLAPIPVKAFPSRNEHQQRQQRQQQPQPQQPQPQSQPPRPLASSTEFQRMLSPTPFQPPRAPPPTPIFDQSVSSQQDGDDGQLQVNQNTIKSISASLQVALSAVNSSSSAASSGASSSENLASPVHAPTTSLVSIVDDSTVIQTLAVPATMNDLSPPVIGTAAAAVVVAPTQQPAHLDSHKRPHSEEVLDTALSAKRAKPNPEEDEEEEEVVEVLDEVRLGEDGWKARYYKSKFGVQMDETERLSQ
jgi:5'-3' exonuclease